METIRKKIPIELLYASGSNCAQRVRWALNYKCIEYRVVNYDDLAKEQLVSLSPLGKVPAMITEEGSFAESIAMLEFIEEMYPDPSLLPRTAILRAKVREAVEIINGWIHPIQCSSVPHFFLPNLSDVQVKDFRLRWLRKTFPVLHDELLFSDSNFAVGTMLTWVDLSLIPIYVKALSLGLETDAFPKFAAHARYCMCDVRIREACPGDLRLELRNRNLSS